jgi:hypothetical protein
MARLHATDHFKIDRRFMIWTGRVVTAVLAARTLYLSVEYLGAVADVERFQVETFTTAFVLAGVLLLLLTNGTRNPGTSQVRGIPTWTCVMWVAGAALIYWPSVRIGLLSDDYVLLDRARHWQLGFANRELFRPVPLLIWGCVLQLGGGAAVLHLLNIAAHGMTSFLSARLAAPLVLSRNRCVAVGLLVLTFPAAVEAVTWCSGVFDVSATLFCVVAILISRHYTRETPRLRRIAFVSCAVIALLCKETAAVIPLLVLVDMWVLRRRSRPLWTDSGVLIALFGLVAVARVLMASSLFRKPLTKYIVQRWAFGTVGGLVVPWHVDILHSLRALPVIGAAVVLILTLMFFVTPSSWQRRRVFIAASAWLFLGTLPTITVLFVAPDLQGSRYLYLPSVGYALLLVTMVSGGDGRVTSHVGRIGVAVLIIIGTIGVHLHQRPWLAAADVRTLVQRAAEHDEDMRACATVAVESLPDSVRGAYVLRNGGALALGEAGVIVQPSAIPSCTFRWEPQRSIFVRRSPTL